LSQAGNVGPERSRASAAHSSTSPPAPNWKDPWRRMSPGRRGRGRKERSGRSEVVVTRNRTYDEFAHLWPLIIAPEDCAAEARYWCDALLVSCRGRRTLRCGDFA